MFATIFAVVFLTAYAAAEIPSYIHICGRRDPKLDKCILDNINNMKSKICKGLPEFDVPSHDPFIVENFAVFDTPEIKLYLRDTRITGFCDFKITNLTINIDNFHYEVKLLFDQVRGNTTYDLNLRLLVPIVSKGPLYITSDNIEAQASVDFSVITKDGKRYTYVSKLKLNIDIKDFDAQYVAQDLANEQLDQLSAIFHHLIVMNKKEILETLKPIFEEKLSKRIIFLSNSIVKHFTYDELFPDRI